MDIATLGISIDSRDTVKATTALNGLAAAAKPAAAASSALGKAANDSAHAHAGLSSQAQAAGHSIRSMVESLASGMPISQTLTQQFGHLSFAASGPTGLSGAFKQAGGALLGLLSPATAVIAAIGAVAAVTVLSISSLAKQEKAFDDTSRAIGVTVSQLHGLESAAAFKGIDTADFLKSMDRMGATVYDAQHGMGSLAETFRANNIQASTFNDYLGKAADLIKNAGSEQQKLQLLQSMGLPANAAWVRYLSQGAEGIKSAAADAAKLSDVMDEALIAKARKFDEEWAKTWKNFSNGAKSAFLDTGTWLDALDAKINAGLLALGVNVGKNLLTDATRGGPTAGTKLTANSSVDDFYKGTGAGLGATAAGPKVKTLAERQKEISDQQTYISLLGQTASSQEIARQVQLSADATYLSTGVAVSKAKIASLKQLAVEQSNGVAGIKAAIDAQNLETASVGMSVGAAAEYATAQNAINEAKRQRRTLSADDLGAIRQEASALGQAAAQADALKFAYTGLVQGPMQTFTSAIQNGSSAMDALKKSGVSALNALSSKLMDMAAQNLWSSAFGGSSGGGIMSLLGLGGSSGALNANGSISGAVGATSVGGAALIPAFAGGTNSAPGGLSLVGEKGPELINLPKGAQVIPNGLSMDMASRLAAPSQQSVQSAPVTVNINMDATGADPAALARVQQQFAQFQADLPARIVAESRKAQQQRRL